MPINNRDYYDARARRRKKKIKWFQRIPVVIWMAIVFCPFVCWAAYNAGFRIESVK